MAGSGRPLALKVAVGIDDTHGPGTRIRPHRMSSHATCLGALRAGSAGRPRVEWVESTWEHVIASAVSVGRPLTPWYLDTYGAAATAEVNLRLSSLFTAVTPGPVGPGPAAATWTLRTTRLMAALDQTEAGGVRFRLGMTMADWFAQNYLGVAQSMHLGALPGLHPLQGFARAGRPAPDLALMDETGHLSTVEAKAGSNTNDFRTSRNRGATQLLSFRNARRGAGSGVKVPAHRQILVATHVPPTRDLFARVLVDADGAIGAPVTTDGPLRGGDPLSAWNLFLRRSLVYHVLYPGSTMDEDAEYGDQGVRIEVDPSGRPVVLRQFSSFGLWVGMTRSAVVTFERQLTQVFGGAMQGISMFMGASGAHHEAVLYHLSDLAGGDRFEQGVGKRFAGTAEFQGSDPGIVVDRSGIAILLDENSSSAG